MPYSHFTQIIREAWEAYDPSREIAKIEDISAKVSTNHVYRITFQDRSLIIGKLSYFGKFEHFAEDHRIINSLSNNLAAPFENFLARSLMKGNQLFIHRCQESNLDVWVVFYRPIEIKKRPPRRLNEEQISIMGEQLALFHKACYQIRHTLPPSSKTLETDIDDLLQILESAPGRHEYHGHTAQIRQQCQLFLENSRQLGANSLESIPVFIDWNIGNFSLTPSFKLFSRWDYDWFRIATRMMDFYFLSRVASDVGDRTIFSYNIGTMMEDRFIIFLKSYHQVFPLSQTEIRFLQEAYRFFILNYVIKYGRYFFHEIFANKLQKEAYEQYFSNIEKEFNPGRLLDALQI